MITHVVYLILAVWATLCLSALVGKVDEFIVVLRRIATAVEAQNAHYGIAPPAAKATPTATVEEADGTIR